MKQSVIKLSMLITCLCIGAYTKAAEDYNQCVYLVSDKKYEAAYLPCLESAERGNAQAQYSFGNMYRNGTGIRKNYKKAVKWYQAAANQGNANAQFSLGVMYFNGNGIPQDYNQAAGWFRLAAEQGNADAEYLLGNMYKNGIGVTQDYKQAIQWYQQAADQGYSIAQYNLGFMYISGQGVKQDITEAVKWYQLAAEQENATIPIQLEITPSNSYDILQDAYEIPKPTTANIQEQVTLRDEYDILQNAYEIPQSDSQQSVPKIKAQASSNTKVETQASSDNSNPPDKANSQNQKELIKWYQLAARQGSISGQYTLGLLYFRGEGVIQDKAKAAKLINNVRNSNHAMLREAAEKFWNKNNLDQYQK